jgi:hypothetical protein
MSEYDKELQSDSEEVKDAQKKIPGKKDEHQQEDDRPVRDDDETARRKP